MLFEVCANPLQTRTCVLCVCVCTPGSKHWYLLRIWTNYGVKKIVRSQVFNIYAERPDEELKPDSWQLVTTRSSLISLRSHTATVIFIQLYRWPMISLVYYHCLTKWPRGIQTGSGNWRLLPSIMETPGTSKPGTSVDSHGLTVASLSSYVKLLLSASIRFYLLLVVSFVECLWLGPHTHVCPRSQHWRGSVDLSAVVFLRRGFNLNCTSAEAPNCTGILLLLL